MSTHLSARIQFEQIIAGILRLIAEPSHFSGLKHFIKPELFYANDSTESASAVRSIIKILLSLESEGLVEKFSFDYIDSLITHKITDPIEGTMVRSHFNTWRNDDKIRAKINDDGCFHSFIDYLRALQIFEISAKFSNHLQRNEVGAAVDMMNNTLHCISKIGAMDQETLKDDDPINTIMHPNTKTSDRVLYLGNPVFDEGMGGFEQGTLNGFIAVTGGGKSMMSHHLIAQCIKQKIGCWVAVLEDRKKSFIYKLMSNLSDIPMRRLKKESAELSSSERARLVEANDLIKQYVHVEFMYGTTIEAIHKASMDYDMECKMAGRERVIPLVNIVDYTGHRASSSAGEKMHEKLRAAYADRKNYVLKYNKIGFDFAQINREGSKNMANKNLITQNDLAGAYDLAQIFDNLISINRTPDDVTTGSVRLHGCKARDSATGLTISVKTAFHKAQYLMNEYEYISGNEEMRSIHDDIVSRGARNATETVDGTRNNSIPDQTSGKIIGISNPAGRSDENR